KGDVEAVMGFFEPQAILGGQPGQRAEGHAGFREGPQGVFGMKPTFNLGKQTLGTGSDPPPSGVKWSRKRTGARARAVQVEGTATDVLRKQADGRWLYVIDNPWGVGVLS